MSPPRRHTLRLAKCELGNSGSEVEMDMRVSAARLGFWVALATAALTVVTFGFAIHVHSRRGAELPGKLRDLSILQRPDRQPVPGDDLWMLRHQLPM